MRAVVDGGERGHEDAAFGGDAAEYGLAAAEMGADRVPFREGVGGDGGMGGEAGVDLPQPGGGRV